MKKVAALMLFVSVLYSAQNHRFIYDYAFIKDTLNKSTVSNELMYLDISREGSEFYSRDAFVADSVMFAAYEKQIQTTGGMNVTVALSQRSKGTVKYKVFKKYAKQEVVLQSKLGRDLFNVWEDRKIVWNILPEKQKIGEFEAQKATTTFGGRSWTAFFAAELPFQDGPYKFHGLPGLIVYAEDASKTHRFELKGVTKFTPSEPITSEFSGKSAPIAISREKYKKLFRDLRNDPAKDLKQMTGNITSMRDKNGAAVSPAELIKIAEKNAKERNAKDNNHIESDLLKP